MNRCFIILFCLFSINTSAQNTRISEHNSIGWYVLNLNVKIADKWTLMGENQFRRTAIIQNWQQEVFRTTLDYATLPNVHLRIGYAFAGTYAYGQTKIQSAGKYFPEHRMFQAIVLSNKYGKVESSQRLMLEQRWIGRYYTAASEKVDVLPLSFRLRYLLRFQLPLNNQSMEDKTVYAAVYDEMLIGFGKNVNENIFDQNRIGALLGYQFTKKFRAEAGYLNQTLQLGREISGRNLLQYNNGIIFSATISI